MLLPGRGRPEQAVGNFGFTKSLRFLIFISLLDLVLLIELLVLPAIRDRRNLALFYNESKPVGTLGNR